MDRATYTGSFLVEVDGKAIGTFTEISGLQVDIAVEEVEEGGQNEFVHKLPGRMKWPNITLKRGVTKSDNLFRWRADKSFAQRESTPDGFNPPSFLPAACASLRCIPRSVTDLVSSSLHDGGAHSNYQIANAELVERLQKCPLTGLEKRVCHGEGISRVGSWGFHSK